MKTKARNTPTKQPRAHYLKKENTAANAWSNLAWIATGIILCLVVGLIMTHYTRNESRDFLSIDNPKSKGAMALAQILRKHGKTVETARYFSDIHPNENQVVVAVQIGFMNENKLEYLKKLAPNLVILGSLGQEWSISQWVKLSKEQVKAGTAPQCDWPGASKLKETSGSSLSLIPLQEIDHQDSQNLDSSVTEIDEDADLHGCFPSSPKSQNQNENRGYAMIYGTLAPPNQSDMADMAEKLRIPSFKLQAPDKTKERDLVILVDHSPFLNENLSDGDNAALALNILGKYDSIAWLDPRFFSSEPDPSPVKMIPMWVWGAAFLSFFAVLLWGFAASWRLGPILRSQMPVTVPSGEVLHGRARLFERYQLFKPMTQTLRRSTAKRLAPKLLLPPQGSSQDLLIALENAGIDRSLATKALYEPVNGTRSEFLDTAKHLRDIEQFLEGKEHG